MNEQRQVLDLEVLVQVWVIWMLVCSYWYEYADELQGAQIGHARRSDRGDDMNTKQQHVYTIAAG